MRGAGSTLWLFTMAALGAWIAVMALDNKVPFNYLAEGSFISPNPVKQGGTVRTHWNLSKVDRTCPRTVQRKFYDRSTGKLVTTLDATPLSRVVNEGETYLSRTFDLPPDLPAETGYRAEICFECNLLQKFSPVCLTTPELPINVIQ